MTSLSYDECIALLGETRFGRLALSVDALPAIYPVCYLYDGTGILIRTRAGGVIEDHCRNVVVAFEIDDWNADASSGWSVLVVGVADALRGSESVRATTSRVVSIGAPDGSAFVRIVPGRVTGRAVDVTEDRHARVGPLR